MNTTELLNMFREDMRDQEAPFLFSDTAIYTYINAAQEWFCRLTEGIEDARSYVLSVVADQDWYPINKRILEIRGAFNTLTGQPIDIVTAETAIDKGIRFSATRIGRTSAMVTGLQRNMLRLYPMPTTESAVVISLSVYRLPKVVDKDDDLEIGDEHHLYLLYWMKKLAYDNHDAETFDRRKADEYDMKFRDYCRKAREEQSRRTKSTGSIAYGGL